VSVTAALEPAVVNIRGYCGDRFALTFTFATSAGVAINMSGSTYTASLRNKATDATALVSFTVDTTSASSGSITVTLSTTQTAALCTGAMKEWVGTFDFQRDEGSNVVRTYFAGTATFTKDRTR
jgi:hypothetical protein